ncbi:hypothetical protein GGR53DRAFT_472240 [Hypoxylon sp. FL1150]|nr:hypothetical protein GGR53DRAFT_472240 [Hypoxylon sp. FL1150]
MGVHDIGTDRFLLEVKSGLCSPKRQVNGAIRLGIVEFANGKILTTFEGMTRVPGTKGHSVINGYSAVNRVEIRDVYEVPKATTADVSIPHDKSLIRYG